MRFREGSTWHPHGVDIGKEKSGEASKVGAPFTEQPWQPRILGAASHLFREVRASHLRRLKFKKWGSIFIVFLLVTRHDEVIQFQESLWERRSLYRIMARRPWNKFSLLQKAGTHNTYR